VVGGTTSGTSSTAIASTTATVSEATSASWTYIGVGIASSVSFTSGSRIASGVTAAYTFFSLASVRGSVSTFGSASILGSGTTVFTSGATMAYYCLCDFLVYEALDDCLCGLGS
jgi:hypothetical protein